MTDLQTFRAESAGISLSASDASVVKGMLLRGDRQSDIAAWFGVNGGRIADIATGKKFKEVRPADVQHLPPRGPYLCGKSTTDLLEAAKAAGLDMELLLRRRDADN